MTVVTKP